MSLPPYARLLGLITAGEEDGAPLLAMPWSAGVMGRPGFLHGGAIGGLLEMAAFAALHARVASFSARRATIMDYRTNFNPSRQGRV